jgi:thioredoxin reductase (NADPH)
MPRARMLNPVLVAGMEQGGQLMITTDVENYPGYADPVQGPWMMEQMLKQAKNVGAEIVNDVITEVDLDKPPVQAVRRQRRGLHADALIIATGAKAKWLGIESEQNIMGFGVSACATCDGFFYRGKDVIVVGGGNSAVEEALYLSNLAAKVTLVHRRDEFCARKDPAGAAVRQRQHRGHVGHGDRRDLGAKNNPAAARGGQRRKAQERKTGDITDMPIDGIFVAIGHAPACRCSRAS